MAPTTATEEPSCPRQRILTLNNANGQKLHIVDPDVYTVEELVWLQLKHNHKAASDKLEIVRGETHAPRDPRSAAIDGLLRQMTRWKLRNPSYETSELLNEDMRRVAEELRKQAEIWQPNTETEGREG